MLIDLALVLAGALALYRGKHTGFVRQACLTGFFFGGLFLGAWIDPAITGLVHGLAAKSIVAAWSTFGVAIIGLAIGEYIGLHLKHRVLPKRINIMDEIFGSALALTTLLLSAWLLAAISASFSLQPVQKQVEHSHIISALNNTLPDAPKVIANIGRLIDPNGFPDVFAGIEPLPKDNVALPSLGVLQHAVAKDRPSVVKVVGQGCGGLVDGSGFVVKQGFIATNAHVVAGIKSPRVIDSKGIHRSTVVWFNANLDVAVLRVNGLTAASLTFANMAADDGLPIAVLGYPGGGPFTAKPGAVLDQFLASGRSIYGRESASRDVYEIKADIIPGNSGGPIVDQSGAVIGMVFAESTSYKHVGYALTSPSIAKAIGRAVDRNQPVSTHRCAE